jgi:hypothetical protein
MGAAEEVASPGSSRRSECWAYSAQRASDVWLRGLAQRRFWLAAWVAVIGITYDVMLYL